MTNTIWNLETEPSAKWVFPQTPEDSVNQIVDFIHHFECSELNHDTYLKISADTDYVVWLNGEIVGHGQYSDFPDQKTYDHLNISSFLKEGSNQFAFSIFYNGRTSSVYKKGAPGLVFEVESDKVITQSGTETLYRKNQSYHSGPIAVVSRQLFYTFGYDARNEDDFTSINYKTDNNWLTINDNEATTPKDRLKIAPRPISKLVAGGFTNASLLTCGYFRRDLKNFETENQSNIREENTSGLILEDQKNISTAALMYRDFLSSRTTYELFDCPIGGEISNFKGGLKPKSNSLANNDGLYFVIDLGIQEVGHLNLEIEAPAGTIMDIGYGEHFEDGRVRTQIGGRNFAARYICKSGRQRFSHHYQRWAGRYIEVHIQSADFKLFQCNLERRDYPIEHKGKINLPEKTLNKIMETCRRTMGLCMHEHYEDTPWREQALYANDARTQALCGYYAFGDPDFPRSSFALLGRSIREDGFLCLTAPAFPPVTIPSFTLVWMLAVRDHFLYTGDDRLAKEFIDQILDMLNRFNVKRKDGLYPLPQEEGKWNFYDWTDGMSGYGGNEGNPEVDAPLNCFLILAIESAQQILEWLGRPTDEPLSKACEELRYEIGNRFWDNQNEVFSNETINHNKSQLTQALAILAKAGTEDMRNKALKKLSQKGSTLTKPGLSQTYYTFQALMTRSDLYAEKVLSDIDEQWGYMLDKGATTFWETIKGASDFHNAGSLCHAWSASPLFIYFHNVLGIKPLSPGYKTFKIEPITSTLSKCYGTVPVPNGEIKFSWEKNNSKIIYNIDKPAYCTIDYNSLES